MYRTPPSQKVGNSMAEHSKTMFLRGVTLAYIDVWDHTAQLDKALSLAVLSIA